MKKKARLYLEIMINFFYKITKSMHNLLQDVYNYHFNQREMFLKRINFNVVEITSVIMKMLF